MNDLIQVYPVTLDLVDSIISYCDISFAVRHEDLYMINRYVSLKSERSEDDIHKLWIMTVRAGKLVVVKYLHQISAPGYDTSVFDWAAASGHLDIVKWLHHTRNEGGSTFAIDMASISGHFEVVKWLVENNYKFTSYAIHRSSIYGRFDIAKYLENVRSKLFSQAMARFSRVNT